MSGDEPDTGTSAVVREICYKLPEHVYACRTDDGVIFLDAKHDRYFGLGGAGVAALPHFVTNWAGGDNSDADVSHAEVHRVADGLIQRGLLCRSRNDSPPQRTCVPPLSVDLPKSVLEADRSVHAVDLIYFAMACVRALWLIKRLPLETIALRVTAARRSEGAPDLVEIFGLVQVFRRLRRLFFSEKDRCLLSAVALVLFLRNYGHFPLFVIGVKTRPFAAHSWVQHGELLLDGDPASICHFVPILVA